MAGRILAKTLYSHPTLSQAAAYLCIGKNEAYVINRQKEKTTRTTRHSGKNTTCAKECVAQGQPTASEHKEHMPCNAWCTVCIVKKEVNSTRRSALRD